MCAPDVRPRSGVSTALACFGRVIRPSQRGAEAYADIPRRRPIGSEQAPSLLGTLRLWVGWSARSVSDLRVFGAQVQQQRYERLDP